MIKPLDEYLFDLNGFLKIENALGKKEVNELNQVLDDIPEIASDEWYGHIHCEAHTYDLTRGTI